MTTIKFKKKDNLFYDLQNIMPVKGEIYISEFPDDTKLSDLVYDYFHIDSDLKPVKCIKIGNGGELYSSLKSIIILNNADFIIVDSTATIIDYIRNSNPIERVRYIEFNSENDE